MKLSSLNSFNFMDAWFLSFKATFFHFFLSFEFKASEKFVILLDATVGRIQ